MSKEREFLKKLRYYASLLENDLRKELEELLAQPEQEGVYQKLLRIEDGVEVEILPSELWQDGYETGKRSVLLSKQPEQEPVAWMYDHQIEVGYDKYTEVNLIETCARNLESNNCINIRPLYLAPPKREPLSEDNLDVLAVLAEANITDEGIAGYYLGFRDAEKMNGIGGGE